MVTTKSHYHGKHIYIYFTGNRYTFLHIKQCESQNESKKKTISHLELITFIHDINITMYNIQVSVNNAKLLHNTICAIN